MTKLENGKVIVLMTEPELLQVFESIFKDDTLYPGEKFDLMFKLLKVTNWLDLKNKKEKEKLV